MKNRLLQSLSFVGFVTLAACGGGGSGGGGGSTPVAAASSAPMAISSIPAAVSSSVVASSAQAASSSIASRPGGELTQTYSVTVDIPTSFLTMAADSANSYLTASHFAVVVVDLAGTITEKIPLYAGEVTLNADGSWSVTFPGSPRLDYVIVVDINQPIALTLGGSIRQNDLVYAPITSHSVDIDLGSTAAYSNLLEELGATGSFSGTGFDPAASANINYVEQILNGIQEIVASQPLNQFSGVTAALASLKTQVAALVEQEVLNIKLPVSGTAVSLVRDEGGMFTYLAFDDGIGLDVSYDALIGTVALASYYYSDGAFIPMEISALDQDLILSSAGWVTPGNGVKASEFNSDGSVVTEWVGAEAVHIKLEAEQVFDLAGRNIHDFLQTDIDTQGLATAVNSTDTFASGAKGYRIKSTFIDKVYSLPLDTAAATGGICMGDYQNKGVAIEALGGNCNAVEAWGANQQYLGNLSSLKDVLSPDVIPEAPGFRAVSYWQSVVVQLLDDSAKTVRFYQQTPVSPDTGSAQTILIGTGTWSQITLPYLTEDATALQVQMTASVDANYLLPDLQLLLVKQAGFIRVAYGFTGLSAVEDSFNGAANSSILGALPGVP